MKRVKGVLAVFFFMALVSFVGPARVSAHCDTMVGPVVIEAQAALEQGDVTPLLKWVNPTGEEEIKTAFRQALSVRASGGEARELADKYFFETLVRVHRAGEGAPYTGLKSGEKIDRAVVMADKALVDGNIDGLVKALTNAVAKGIQQRFQHAHEARQHAGDSVDAGREYVAAYVAFAHYVEGLHGMVQSCGGHQGAAGHAAH